MPWKGYERVLSFLDIESLKTLKSINNYHSKTIENRFLRTRIIGPLPKRLHGHFLKYLDFKTLYNFAKINSTQLELVKERRQKELMIALPLKIYKYILSYIDFNTLHHLASTNSLQRDIVREIIIKAYETNDLPTLGFNEYEKFLSFLGPQKNKITRLNTRVLDTEYDNINQSFLSKRYPYLTIFNLLKTDTTIKNTIRKKPIFYDCVESLPKKITEMVFRECIINTDEFTNLEVFTMLKKLHIIRCQFLGKNLNLKKINLETLCLNNNNLDINSIIFPKSLTDFRINKV